MGLHGISLSICITLALVLGCRPGSPSHGRPAGVLVGVADVSGSTDATTRCAELLASLTPLTTEVHLRRLDVLFLATGDDATGEPRVLLPWTTWSPSAELFEAPDAADKQRRVWLAAAYRTCTANIRPSDVSPVYEGVRAARAAIDAHCHDLERAGFTCTRKALAVKSDLRSTYGPFGAYLRALAKPPKRGHLPEPPTRLNLDGIDASFCGTANTGIRDGLSVELVLKAWAAALGAAPIADPTCERASPIVGEAAP